jgi:hypothetical protein
MSPVSYARGFFNQPIHKAWVREIRKRYDIELSQLDVPVGLVAEVEAYLTPYFRRAEDATIPPFMDQEIRDIIDKMGEEFIKDFKDVVVTFIVSGRIQAAPPHVLGSILVREHALGDGSSAPFIHAMGGPLTDWNQLAEDMKRKARELYGRPPAGRRRGSAISDFVEDCLSQGVSEPIQMAMLWAEQHPEDYPEGEFDTGIDTLREALRKAVQRLKG